MSTREVRDVAATLLHSRLAALQSEYCWRLEQQSTRAASPVRQHSSHPSLPRYLPPSLASFPGHVERLSAWPGNEATPSLPPSLPPSLLLTSITSLLTSNLEEQLQETVLQRGLKELRPLRCHGGEGVGRLEELPHHPAQSHREAVEHSVIHARHTPSVRYVLRSDLCNIIAIVVNG